MERKLPVKLKEEQEKVVEEEDYQQHIFCGPQAYIFRHSFPLSLGQ